MGEALVGLGLIILFAKLDGPVVRLITRLLGNAATEELALLPNFVPAVWLPRVSPGAV